MYEVCRERARVKIPSRLLRIRHISEGLRGTYQALSAFRDERTVALMKVPGVLIQAQESHAPIQGRGAGAQQQTARKRLSVVRK